MIKKFLFMVLVIVLVSAVAGYLHYNKFLQTPLTISSENKVFTLQRGWSARQLSQALVEERLLEDVWLFDIYLRLSKQANKLQAGEYLLTSEMTPKQLAKKFSNGEVTHYKFTIIEGWSFKQLRASLAENRNISHTLTDVDDETLMEKIGLTGVHPEGQFLPDTYHFIKNTSDLEFLKKAHSALMDTLTLAWENRAPDLQLKSTYEALIMASIIEKETGAAQERKKISGVFNLRLKKKMRLQTDPTVIYGMGDDYNGNIRRRDLRRDTPYNTYTRKGLPPTPIAMPGKAAIDAAVNPENGKELYFVARGDGTGRHKFSVTIEEHNAAVRKYQLHK